MTAFIVFAFKFIGLFKSEVVGMVNAKEASEYKILRTYIYFVITLEHLHCFFKYNYKANNKMNNKLIVGLNIYFSFKKATLQ